MSTTTKNRFLHDPSGYTDEDGDFAFIDIASETDTFDKARAWLVAHSSDVTGSDWKILPEKIDSPPFIGLSMRWPGLLPEVWEVERLIREGLCEAWWRLDISCAREEIVDQDWEAEHKRHQAERYAQEKRRAAEWRGPWWWRLRYAIAQRLMKAASNLEPDDVSSVAWEEDGQYIIRVVRRPT